MEDLYWWRVPDWWYDDIDDELASLLNAVVEACNRVKRQAVRLAKEKKIEEVDSGGFRVPDNIVSGLKRMMKEQAYLQVLLGALLTALYRRYNYSSDFRYGLIDGGEIVEGIEEEPWSLNDPGQFAERFYYHYIAVIESLVRDIQEQTLDIIYSKKIYFSKLYKIARFYTGALNYNRLLLTRTYDLLRAITEHNQQVASRESHVQPA